MEINDKWSLSGFRLEPVQAEALLIFYPRRGKPKTKVIPKWELSIFQCKHWWSVIWHSCLPEGTLYVGATSLVCMMEVCRLGLHSPCMYGICLSDTCYMGDCKSTWTRPEINYSKEPTWVLNFSVILWWSGMNNACVWNRAMRGCSHSHVMISHALFTLCCILSFFCPLCFRIAVFSVPVLHDDRIVLVAEQRPDASEEDSFQWMSRVLQVVSLSFSLSRWIRLMHEMRILELFFSFHKQNLSV